MFESEFKFFSAFILVYPSEIWTVSLLFFFLRQAMMSVTERGSDFIALILLHQYPAHILQLKNNMALAPQRLVHNEKYAAVEHQGHCRIGFLKRAEKSSTEWANKARWLMNSRNSLTNPIASDKLKCQRPACVASHYLCYSVISLIAEPAAHGVWKTAWDSYEDRGTVTGDLGRCLSLSIDWTRRPDDFNSHWRRLSS